MANHSNVAVLAFTGAASPFEPFWPATHRALLPICGKAMIVHLMESLLRAGYRHVRVAGTVQHHAAHCRLGDGTEWGMRIRYTDIHGTDLLNECLAANGRCLFLNGDELHAYPLDPSDDLWLPGEPPHGSANGPAAFCEVKGTGTSARSPDAAGGNWLPIHSVPEYHEANQRLAAGELDLVIPGAALHDFNAHVDWRTEIARDAYVGHGVFIGKHAFIDRQVRLEERCVLANGVIVGAGSRLSNVTVLPNCQIREGTVLRDAVIAPEGVYDLSCHRTDPVRLQESGDVVVRSRPNDEATTGLPEPLAR